MQLQFEKQTHTCLQTVKRENQNQEQTQELRISDGMPDIGRIVGAWGQVILRGKEWQSDAVVVNGGTKVWVQYIPEEGGEPYCVESWLPFQMHWDIPESQSDGTIHVQCFLRSVDARGTSARKLIVRTNLSVSLCAMAEQEWTVYAPNQLPEDIQLRYETYPVELFAEAGEKAFSLEEALVLPSAVPSMEQLVSYQMQPQITEVKFVGDKVVFRGNAMLHILYKAKEGGLYSWDTELPFTQYSDLQSEYPENGRIQILPCITALEIDKEEEQYQLKAGIVCQYCICNRHMVEVITDAYSPRRGISPQCQELQLPGILEYKAEPVHPQLNITVSGMRLVDTQFLPEPLNTHTAAQENRLEIGGRFQLLYYDMEGQLSTAHQRWELQKTVDMGPDTMLNAMILPEGAAQGNLLSGNAQLSADLRLVTETVNGTPITMLSGIEAEEMQDADPNRPSLILRRADTSDLWTLAKENGSTVTAIREANGLHGDECESKMLLIPIV